MRSQPSAHTGLASIDEQVIVVLCLPVGIQTPFPVVFVELASSQWKFVDLVDVGAITLVKIKRTVLAVADSSTCEVKLLLTYEVYITSALYVFAVKRSGDQSLGIPRIGADQLNL